MLGQNTSSKDHDLYNGALDLFINAEITFIKKHNDGCKTNAQVRF